MKHKFKKFLQPRPLIFPRRMPLIPVGPGMGGFTCVTTVSGDIPGFQLPANSSQENKQWLDDICIAKTVMTTNGKCVTNYICKECSRVFFHPSKLKEHYRVHTGERPFKCSICSSAFSQKSSLSSHFRTHTTKRPYECRLCDAKFTTSSHRMRHERAVHADVFCSQSVSNTYEGPPHLSPQHNHMDEYNYNGVYTIANQSQASCSTNISAERDRQRVFLKPANTEGHLQMGEEYQEVVFANELPPIKGRRRRPDEYKQVVVDSRIYDMAAPRPKNFGKIGINNGKLKKPMTAGVKDQTINIVVDAVARGMDPSEILTRSKRSATVRECEYCGKKLKYPSRILEHLRTHTKEKPFVCPICHTGFAQQTTLRMHLRRHMDTRLFVCPTDGCQSSFINGALLNLHVKEVHQQKRRFACLNGCGKVFRSNSARSKHELENCGIVSHEMIPEDMNDQPEFIDGTAESEDITVEENEYIIEEWKEDEHGNVIYEEDQGYEDNYFYEEVEHIDLEKNFTMDARISTPRGLTPIEDTQ